MSWRNREAAAKELVKKLKNEQAVFDVVLALPRGGVQLGAVVAKKFNKPLDLLIPRKIGAMGNEEYAIGAVTEEGLAVWNEAEKELANPDYIDKKVSEQRHEARRRREKYLGTGHRAPILGQRVLIVDDGIATGLTMRAAIAEARQLGAAHIHVAVPVAPPDSLAHIVSEVDQVTVLDQPEMLGAVGAFYKDFPQVSDEEVIELMQL